MGAEFVMSSVYTNAIFGVFTSTFFEEIGFPLGGGWPHHEYETAGARL
jgi:hypothetical protein